MQCINNYYKIIKIAEKLFATKGFKGTTLREIAEKVGIDKATIYHYFKNKEEMLFKIMNNEMDEALLNLKKIVLNNYEPEENFKLILKYYIQYYAGNPEGLILLVNEQENLNKEYQNILKEKQKEYVDFFKKILLDLQKRDFIKDIPFQIIIFGFLGMVHYTIKWYNINGNIDLDNLSEYFIEMILNGIKKVD